MRRKRSLLTLVGTTRLASPSKKGEHLMPLSPVMGWGVAGFPLCLLTLVCRIALAPDLCGQYPPVIRGEGGGGVWGLVYSNTQVTMHV